MSSELQHMRKYEEDEEEAPPSYRSPTMQRMPLFGELKPVYTRPMYRYVFFGFAATCIFLFTAGSLLFHPPPPHSRGPLPPLPNIYHCPGVLDVSATSPAKFRPLGDTRLPVDYLRLLNASEVPSLIELEAIKNKFVLIYGDSLDRKALDTICSSVGSRRTCVDMDNEFAPRENCTRTTLWDSNHYCYIPQINTTIINIQTFGVVAEDNEFWAFKEPNYPVRIAPDTIDLVKENAGARHPDMIIMNSGLWDLATWNVENALANAKPTTQISFERIRDYERKLGNAVQQLQNAFPHSPMLMRDAPLAGDSGGTWFIEGLPHPEKIQPYSRAPFSDARIHQINMGIHSVASRLNLEIFPFGSLIAGQTEFYEVGSAIHPDNVLNYLYGNMLFEFLVDLERNKKRREMDEFEGRPPGWGVFFGPHDRGVQRPPRRFFYDDDEEEDRWGKEERFRKEGGFRDEKF